MDKIKKFIKENKMIAVILLVSLILHIITSVTLGFEYTIDNDDARYLVSGFNFRKMHVISIFGDDPSAMIMPGISVLVGFISFLFGEGKAFFIAIKFLYMFISLLSTFGLYKLSLLLVDKLKNKKTYAALTTIPFLFPSFLWMDNVLLTETPFMCAFIYLLYFTIKEGKEHSRKNFIVILILYFIVTMFKANFAIYPLLLVSYLLLKKYDWRLLIKEVLIAGCALSLFFVPWIVRNYKLYDAFIPLTYGTGTPEYWGTFQGYGYPEEEELDFDGYLATYDDENIQAYLKGEDAGVSNYYALKIESIHAKYRMQEWWKKDKLSFIISYTILKPIRLFAVFYWENLFGITRPMLMVLRVIELAIILFGLIVIFAKKKFNKEMLFLLVNLLVQVAVYSATFTFSRYGQVLMFILVILGVYGIGLFLEGKKTKKKVR